MKTSRIFLLLMLALCMSACGGGGSSSSDPAPAQDPPAPVILALSDILKMINEQGASKHVVCSAKDVVYTINGKAVNTNAECTDAYGRKVPVSLETGIKATAAFAPDVKAAVDAYNQSPVYKWKAGEVPPNALIDGGAVSNQGRAASFVGNIAGFPYKPVLMEKIDLGNLEYNMWGTTVSATFDVYSGAGGQKGTCKMAYDVPLTTTTGHPEKLNFTAGAYSAGKQVISCTFTDKTGNKNEVPDAITFNIIYNYGDSGGGSGGGTGGGNGGSPPPGGGENPGDPGNGGGPPPI